MKDFNFANSDSSKNIQDMPFESTQTSEKPGWQDINDCEKRRLRKCFELIWDDHLTYDEINDGRAEEVDIDDRLLLPVVLGVD